MGRHRQASARPIALLILGCVLLVSVVIGNAAELPIVQLAKAIEAGDLAQVKKLLAQGVDPNRRIPEYRTYCTPLFVAVEKGKLDIARVLLNSGADPKIENQSGDPVMVFASDAGREPFARLLMESGVGIDSTNSKGVTALMRGVRYDEAADVQAKLALGADPHQRDAYGRTPLIVAASGGNLPALRVLAAAGARADARDKRGRTALTYVALGMDIDTEVVGFLLDAGADVNAQDDKGRTAAMAAFTDEWRFRTNALVFLDAEPDLNVRDEDGQTLLFHVVRANAPSVHGSDLIRRGADPTVVNKAGVDLVMLAAAEANTETLELLLDHKVPANRTTKDGYTAVHRAARRRPDEYRQKTDEQKKAFNSRTMRALDLLKKHGASLTVAAEDGRTPLHEAAEHGAAHTVAYLLAAYDRPDVVDLEGVTPFHLAAARRDKNACDLLLAKGADVNATYLDGMTAMLAAIERDDTATVKYLQREGSRIRGPADVNRLLLQKSRCLHDRPLSEEQYADLISILAEQAQNLEERDADGMTPLMWVAASDNLDALRAILAKKPNIDAASNDGRTVLMWAAAAVATNAMAVLTEAGADTSLRDRSGRSADDWLKWAQVASRTKGLSTHRVEAEPGFARRITKAQQAVLDTYVAAGKWNAADRLFGTSPLHLAAALGDTNALDRLLSRNANVNLRGDDGTTPLIAAAANGRTRACALLLKRGAEINWEDSARASALDWAIRLEHFETVRFLAKQKDALEGDATSVLNAAIAQDDVGLLRDLLRAGASVGPPEKDPFRWDRPEPVPVIYAASRPSSKLLAVLRKYPKATGFGNAGNLGTALHKAAEEGRLENVQYLIEKVGVDVSTMLKSRFGGVRRIQETDRPEHKIETRFSALSGALEQGHHDIVRYLVERGAKIAGRTRGGPPPVSFVVIHGQHKLLRLFLKKGAPTDDVDFDARTALHHAAERNDVTSIRLLLRHGANRAAKDRDGATPLGVAEKAKAKEAVAVLSQEQ